MAQRKETIIGSKIRNLRTSQNLTLKELAKRLNISASALANYEYGFREPNSNALIALEQYFGVTGAYLRGEVDENFEQDSVSNGILLNGVVRDNVYKDICSKLSGYPPLVQRDFFATLNNVHISMLRLLPGPQLSAALEQFNDVTTRFTFLSPTGRTKLLERADELQLLDKRAGNAPAPDAALPTPTLYLRISMQPASAGTGVYLGPEAFEECSVPATELTKRAEFGVPVSGDSMEPMYHDGDIILVDFAPVEVGDIALVTMDGAGYVKQIGKGHLLSLNGKYKPIPMDDTIRINGRVIGAVSADDIR